MKYTDTKNNQPDLTGIITQIGKQFDIIDKCITTSDKTIDIKSKQNLYNVIRGLSVTTFPVLVILNITVKIPTPCCAAFLRDFPSDS